MAGSAFATAGTPKDRFSDLHRTNGTRFSEAHETENSIVSAGSDRRKRTAVASIRTEAECPSESSGALRFLALPTLIAVLQHLGELDDLYGIAATLLGALPPGSYLALSHPAEDIDAVSMAKCRAISFMQCQGVL